MTPFAIAGIQMHVAAAHPNVDALRHKIDLAMARFPWTQMVLFSELAAYGPLTKFAQPLENDTIRLVAGRCQAAQYLADPRFDV